MRKFIAYRLSYAIMSQSELSKIWKLKSKLYHLASGFATCSDIE
jgi:hypothetical protein